MGIPASSRTRASFNGVCPPSATMTPRERAGTGEVLQPGADVEHVFFGEGLEEESVARVVVGGDGLRIAVDHHRLVARVAQGERGVHTAVVELDTLADPVRAAAEDHDGFALEGRELVFVFVGAVVVRRERGELGRARVDGLVGDAHSRREARGAHDVGRDRPEVRELDIAETVPLGLAPVGARHRREAELTQPIAFFHDLEHLVEEPRIDPRDLVQAFDRDEFPERGLDLEDPFRRRNRGGGHQLLDAEAVVLAFDRITVQPARPDSRERSAFWSDSGNVRPIAITSPTDCICVPSTGAAPGNFSNAHRGTLVTT